MDIYQFISENISHIENPIVFEIGSHIGIDSEKISEIVGSKIYGFEPDPRNLEILTSKRSEFFHEISTLAISNNDGKSNFYLSSGTAPEEYEDEDMNRDWSASNSLKLPRKHLDLHQWCKFDWCIEVETIKLDTYCKNKNIDHIDFIWMDVQGAEDLVIEGMGDFKNNIRFIYTEYNNDDLYDGSPTLEKIVSMLGEGWSIEKVYENDVLLKNNNI